MIVDLAARRALLSPDRPAIWFRGRWYSYGELDRRAARLAAALAASGVERGDRVSIVAANHLAHLDLVLATAKLGFAFTPFNHRLSETELAELAGYVRPALLLHDAATAARAAAAVHGLPTPLRSLEDYEEWLAEPRDSPAPPDLDPEDIQMILFTGGTTGVPKGAMLPYRQGFYNAVNTVFAWGLRDDDCAIQATPCFHAALNALTLPLLHIGGRVVLQEAFEPGEYLRLAHEHRATLLFMVPTMYQMLHGHPGFRHADLSTVRWAITGGAPCPAPVREVFSERGIRFRQGYGLTEAGVNCFAIELDDAQQRPNSVGHPMPHGECVIRGPRGEALPPGEVGELTIRGPHVFAGYFERPEATAEVLRDGWLWTGDLARQDEEGFFYLAGRRKEMFISGGENVFPAEIENVLYGHPRVAECAVVGVPHERWGEAGLAAVVVRPDAEEDDPVALEPELREFLRSHLAGYKVPKRFLFLQSLPKSGAGKVLKREIVRMAVEGGS